MICKLLRTIELLDELQYWLDNWTPANGGKRYDNFDRIWNELFLLGDDASADVADKARRMSVYLPFRLRKNYGLSIPDAQSISEVRLIGALLAVTP